MIKLYFNLFYRRIKQNRSLFILNFAGYIVLISVISFTALFIYGELNYDNFKKKDRIYRLVNSLTLGSRLAYNVNIESTIPEDLKNEYPDIESVVNLFFVRDVNIEYSKKQLNHNVTFFEGDFVNIFTPELISGNNDLCNKEKNVCFISESFSKNLFGTDKSFGETLVLANNNDTIQVQVAGVIKNFRNTTCMQGDIFVKSEVGFSFYEDYSDLSFLLLREKSTIENLNNIQAKEYEHNGIDYKESLYFQPIREVYLKSEFLNFNFYPSGNLKLIIILLIALLLMFSSVIFNYNFMFIVLTSKRIKEYCLKRIHGVEKRNVFYGILADSTLFVFTAASVAFLISKIAISYIESLSIVLSKYTSWLNIAFLTVSLAIFIITIVIPKFYYKSIIKIRHVERLDFNFEVKRKKTFGFIFLGMQVIVAFTILAFSFTVKSQLHYAVNKDLGIKNQNLIILKNELSEQKYFVFSEEIKKFSSIFGITRIGKLPPSEFPQRMTRIKCFGVNEKEILTAILTVDKNTLETLGVKYVLGDGFQNINDYRSCCVVSKSLAEQLNVDKVIGYEVIHGKKIIGVVEDISMTPTRKENYPTIIYCSPELCDEIVIGIQETDAAIFDNISKIYKSINRDTPQWTFYEDHLNSLYKEEGFMLKYVVTFSSLTLCLVFLGFYLYSTATINIKSKDIVVRKIHGASFQDIFKLLLKEYLLIFIVAILIACLLFFYMASTWLSRFAYHIDLNLVHYIFPAFLIMSILLIAVMNGILSLARKNIVKTIS